MCILIFMLGKQHRVPFATIEASTSNVSHGEVGEQAINEPQDAPQI